MTEQEYITERIDDQIKWYGKKSGINKRWYNRCQMALLFLATLITLSAVVGKEDELYHQMRIIVPLMGALIAIITGIMKINKYQDNWMTYRSTSEALKQEKIMFLTKCEPYGGSNAFKILVQRAESLMSSENSSWVQYMGQNVDATQ